MNEQECISTWEIRQRKAKDYFSTRAYAPKELVESGALTTLAEIEICNHIHHQRRFWNKVNASNVDECWNWMRQLNVDGYGAFAVKNIPVRSSRVCYRLCFGNIPNDMSVLHKCDNRACCNPDHLFLGTQSDNLIDCIKKGRGSLQKVRYEDYALIRLDIRDVRQIASDYKISVSRVRHIKAGRCCG